jgi:hypothetical protein
MLKRKTKMVNIRLTDEEHAALLKISASRGENVSALIRATMQQVFPNDPRSADHDLFALWDRVQALSNEMENLRRMLMAKR